MNRVFLTRAECLTTAFMLLLFVGVLLSALAD